MGSASLHGQQLVFTAVNLHATEPRETEIRLRGASAKSVRGRVLVAYDIHAHNDFEHPDFVQPRDFELNTQGSTLHHVFPPASVSRLVLDLG
jgi:alpha-N-arabinofuranosidase